MEKARALSGIDRISDLVREGLRALIAREARRRLVALGGSDALAKSAPRMRDPDIAAENAPVYPSS